MKLGFLITMHLNKKTIKEKKLRRAFKAQNEASEKCRDLESQFAEEQKIPVGYSREFRISNTIRTLKDVGFFEEILPHINKRQYSNYQDFPEYEELQTRELSEREFLTACKDPQWKAFLQKYFCRKKYVSFPSALTGKCNFDYSYAWIWKEAFEIEVYTHYMGLSVWGSGIQYRNSEARKKEAEANRNFEKLRGRQAWLKTRKGYVQKDECWQEDAYIAKISRQSLVSTKKRNIKRALRQPIWPHNVV